MGSRRRRWRRGGGNFFGAEDVAELGTLFIPDVETEAAELAFEVSDVEGSVPDDAIRNAQPERWRVRARDGLADKLAFDFEDSGNLSQRLVVVGEDLQAAATDHSVECLRVERKRPSVTPQVVDVIDGLLPCQLDGSLDHLPRQVEADDYGVAAGAGDATREISGAACQVQHQPVFAGLHQLGDAVKIVLERPSARYEVAERPPYVVVDGDGRAELKRVLDRGYSFFVVGAQVEVSPVDRKLLTAVETDEFGVVAKQRGGAIVRLPIRVVGQACRASQGVQDFRK